MISSLPRLLDPLSDKPDGPGFSSQIQRCEGAYSVHSSNEYVRPT